MGKMRKNANLAASKRQQAKKITILGYARIIQHDINWFY